MNGSDDSPGSAAVLLVDDMPANLLALQAALAPLDVKTILASSGPDALSWIERRTFAVALVDVRMPGMDGFELVERLRQTKNGRELPVIFVTAHSDDTYMQRGYATGAADYLTKPFDALIVRARVKAFVDLFEQREAVRRGQVALRTHERDEAIRRLVAFERIASAALETNDLRALLDELLHAFIDAADAADSAAILLRDGEYLKVAASIGLQDKEPDDFRVRIGRGFAGLVASERRALEISEDAIARLVQSPMLRKSNPRALYGVPLLSSGQLVGVAHIGSTREGRFSAQEKKLFAAAAERAALVVAKQLQSSLQSEIFAEVPAYLCIVSSDSMEYTFVNAPLRDLFGQSLLGMRVGDAGFGLEVISAIERCRKLGQPVWVEELRVRRKDDDTPLYLRLSAQPLRDSAGVVDRFLLFASDISEQVNARLQVESIMAERAELLRRERRARELAESASTAKDEFLATVSHELRTPLTSILGWSSLLRTRPGTDAEKALVVIDRNARSLARIVEDVLDFSRISKGKMRLALQEVDLAEVVRSAWESLRPAAEARNISIEFNLEQPCFLAADPTRLQQVVWNLLSNAVKYNGQGGHVKVEGKRVGERVSLEVSDCGQGIDPEFLPHVFEPFRQANGATTRRHGGLGLGLAIVRQIVDAHGGDIEAHSAGNGNGASFTLHLPVEHSARISGGFEAEANAESLTEPTSEVRLDGVRVLVVDDDDDGRELMARVLTVHGAEVSLLPSAEQALLEIERFRPDVLVSDIAMAELDGYGLIRRVRQMDPERGGATPAIAVTAHAGKEVVQKVLQLGFQRYAAKPLDIELLVVSVSDLARLGPVRPVTVN